MPTKAKPMKVKYSIDEDTGLKVDQNGNYLIVDREDAEVALEVAAKSLTKIDNIRRRNNMDSLEATIKGIREGLRDWQDENDVKELVHDGWKSVFIERTKSLWIWSKDQIPESANLSDVIPLQDIIRRKFRDTKARIEVTNKVTTRVVDRAKLDMVVREGILAADDIQDALYEFIDAQYVKLDEI